MPAFLHVGCLPFPFLRAYFLVKDIKVKKAYLKFQKLFSIFPNQSRNEIRKQLLVAQKQVRQLSNRGRLPYLFLLLTPV